MADFGWRAPAGACRAFRADATGDCCLCCGWGESEHGRSASTWADASRRRIAASLATARTSASAEETIAPPARRFVTTDEYLAEQDDPAPSLLGDCLVVKGGVHVFASEPGVCKTSYFRALAVHLSAGVEFHGLAVPSKLTVLLCEAEGNRTINRQRFRLLCAALGLTSEVLHMGRDTGPPQIDRARAAPLGGSGAPEPPRIGGELHDAIRETRAAVCFLDTAAYFADFDENSASDWKRYVFKPLREIARAFEWSPAFVLSHHFAKPSDQRGGVHRLRGSSAISGDADTVVTFERASGDRILQKFEKIKGPPLEDRVLVLERETGVVRWDRGGNAGTLAEPRMVTVVEIVERPEYHGAIGTADLLSALRKATGCETRTAEALVASTVRNGLIAHPKRGVYTPRGRLLE